MIRVTTTLRTGRLDGLTAALRGQVAAHVAKTALDVQADAQANAPVRTGTLRRSIAARKESDLAWRVAVGVNYGVYVEFGARGRAPRPFLTPAAEKHRAPFRDGVRRLLQGGR